MFMLMFAALALTQFIPDKTALQPRTYESPSRIWSVSVDPSRPDGGGKSTVSILKQGKVQWTGEKPFTLCDVVVNDDGISAGCGYTKGLYSFQGAMVVAVLGAGGESLLVDETPRGSGPGVDSGPGPFADHLTLNADRNIALMSVPFGGEDQDEEGLWSFQLSPAKKLDVQYPRRKLEVPEDHYHAMALAAVRGTPLTLAQWDLYHWDAKPRIGPGSEFALYDEAGNLVWSLALPGDNRRDDEDEEDRLWWQYREQGGILDTKSERRFDVRQVAKEERVTFEVSRDTSAKTGWTVREIARAPYVKADPPKKKPELAKLELRAADPVALDVGVTGATGPVRDIQNFTIAAVGEITFVRGEETKGAVSLVTIDATGKLLRQVAVAPIEPESADRRAWNALAGGDWLLTLSPWEGNDPQSRAWRITGATGASRELTEFHGPEIERIEPTEGGGFVLLGKHSLEYTIKSEVRRCTATGSTMWSLEEEGYGRCEGVSALCMAEDVEVDADGSILVLDHSRKLVQCFDAKGAFVKAIQLESAWEDSDSSYLTDMVLEPSGSILIHDIHDQHRWRRISRSGQQLATFIPKRENGSADGGDISHARVDREGRLWTHDEHELLVYDEQGVVRGRFGTAADPHRLAELGGAFQDGAGRVAIADGRTHAVHLFDAGGHRSVVCTPDATDFDDEYSIDAVLTAPDGTIYVQPSQNRDSYLAFAADGKRIGRVQLGGERVAFDRRAKERWAAGEGEDDVVRLRRFGTDGSVRFDTDRRPDGHFFQEIEALACAPDGSVVVLDVLDDSGTLCFYNAKGDAQRQVALDDDENGFDGDMQVGRRWLVIGEYGHARLFSLADGKCALFEPSTKTVSPLGLSLDEAQLWAFEWNPARLHRFTLPK